MSRSVLDDGANPSPEASRVGAVQAPLSNELQCRLPRTAEGLDGERDELVVLVVQALVQVVMVVVLNKQARQEQQEVDILVEKNRREE